MAERSHLSDNPRSFSDGNADGVGDLQGIRQQLDYLQWLGVDAIWLSPIFPSPMADFGYDVSDYCDVDPIFGDLETLDRLISETHERGLRIMLDWVPNHTSDQHPWFVDSRSSRESPKRDWYIWRDGAPDRPPNDWASHFSGPAWTWDKETQQWYLHLFAPEQPDLNWHNPHVAQAMMDILRFWLDRGIDGFRADVLNLISKEPALVEKFEGTKLAAVINGPRMFEFLREIRSVLDSYQGNRAMVGEVHLPTEIAATYSDHDLLNTTFVFAGNNAVWDSKYWKDIIERVEAAFGQPGRWPAWVLSNHDETRHRSRFGGSEARARVAALMLLTLRGTPFLYQGEELGLLDADIPPDRRVDPDPKNRDKCRAPIPWNGSPQHGWGENPWLPFPPQPESANVEFLQSDDNSILHFYRRLLAARRSSAALRLGSLAVLDGPDGVLRYERELDGERLQVIANFGTEPIQIEPDGQWILEVATRVPGAAIWNGLLGADEAVMIRPSQE